MRQVGALAELRTEFLKDATMTTGEIASRLGLADNDFMMAVTSRTITSGRGSVVIRKLSAREATENIDGLIKYVYSRIFRWIVACINMKQQQHQGQGNAESDGACGAQERAAMGKDTNDVAALPFIGILDIFGFEILNRNSFEQLLINFANEALQRHFNEEIFEAERNMYTNEGLDASMVTYTDNKPVIDTIGGARTGLLALVEEQGKLNRAPDNKSLLIKFNQVVNSKGKSDVYVSPKLNADKCFIIRHFAGTVTYEIDEFLEKNKLSRPRFLIYYFLKT